MKRSLVARCASFVAMAVLLTSAATALAQSGGKPTAPPKPMYPESGPVAPRSTPSPATPTPPAVPPTPAPTAAPTPRPSTPTPAATPAPTAPPAPTSSPTPAGPPSPVRFQLCAEGMPTDGMWKCDPIMGDFNKDGKIDIVGLPRLGKGPRAWIGDGTGRWTESSEGLQPGDRSCGGGLDFADVNGDGHLDLLVADHCQGVYVYLGDGAGKWNMVVQELYPTDIIDQGGQTESMMYPQGAEDIAAGDVNGDGHVDLLVGASDRGGINVFLGDGSGKNWTRSTTSGLPLEDWANRVELVDMNGDGSLDIVAAYAPGPRVWLNDGKGVFSARELGLPTPIVKGLYTGFAVGDIDLDGRLDIAIANWVDGPEVYLQQPDESWKKMPDVFPQMEGGAVGLDLGDLDGDGKLDIVVSGRLTRDAGYVRGVFALLGDGRGAFRHVPDSGLPNTGLAATAGVAIGDLNGDKVPDVVAGSGLIVETAEGPKEPVIPQRLLVWCGAKASGN